MMNARNIFWWILWFIRYRENKIEDKYKLKKLFLKAYNYTDWFENEESTDKEESEDLSDIPPQGGAQKVKQLKQLKI